MTSMIFPCPKVGCSNEDPGVYGGSSGSGGVSALLGVGCVVAVSGG